MPSRVPHALLGAAAGGALALILLPKDCQDRGYLILAAAGAGALAGLTPDLFEPALHPNHRSIFHSVVCGMAVAAAGGYFGKRTWDSARSEDGLNWMALIAFAAAIGYDSHLGADAFTPKHLPFLIGGK